MAERLRFEMVDEYDDVTMLSMEAGSDHATLEPAEGPLIHLWRDDLKRLEDWLHHALSVPAQEV